MRLSIWTAAAALAASAGLANAGTAELQASADHCAGAFEQQVIMAAPAGGPLAEIGAVEGRVQRAAATGWTEATAGTGLAVNDQMVLDEDARVELGGTAGAVTVTGPALLTVAAAGGHGCLLREDTRLVAQDGAFGETGPGGLPGWALPAIGGAAAIGVIAAIASSSGSDAPPPPVSP